MNKNNFFSIENDQLLLNAAEDLEPGWIILRNATIPKSIENDLVLLEYVLLNPDLGVAVLDILPTEPTPHESIQLLRTLLAAISKTSDPFFLPRVVHLCLHHRELLSLRAALEDAFGHPSGVPGTGTAPWAVALQDLLKATRFHRTPGQLRRAAEYAPLAVVRRLPSPRPRHATRRHVRTYRTPSVAVGGAVLGVALLSLASLGAALHFGLPAVQRLAQTVTPQEDLTRIDAPTRPLPAMEGDAFTPRAADLEDAARLAFAAPPDRAQPVTAPEMSAPAVAAELDAASPTALEQADTASPARADDVPAALAVIAAPDLVEAPAPPLADLLLTTRDQAPPPDTVPTVDGRLPDGSATPEPAPPAAPLALAQAPEAAATVALPEAAPVPPAAAPWLEEPPPHPPDAPPTPPASSAPVEAVTSTVESPATLSPPEAQAPPSASTAQPEPIAPAAAAPEAQAPPSASTAQPEPIAPAAAAPEAQAPPPPTFTARSEPIAPAAAAPEAQAPPPPTFTAQPEPIAPTAAAPELPPPPTLTARPEPIAPTAAAPEPPPPPTLTARPEPIAPTAAAPEPPPPPTLTARPEPIAPTMAAPEMQKAPAPPAALPEPIAPTAAAPEMQAPLSASTAQPEPIALTAAAPEMQEAPAPPAAQPEPIAPTVAAPEMQALPRPAAQPGRIAAATAAPTPQVSTPLPAAQPERMAAAASTQQPEAGRQEVRRSTLTPLPASSIEALIRRADSMAALGDISAARLLYGRAAAAGNGQAMLALGRTHDPLFLADIGARGMPGDVATAVGWYRRALALGVTEAQELLARHGIRSGE